MIFFSGTFCKLKAQHYYILKVFEGNLKNVCQKAIKTNSSSFRNTSNVPMFHYHVIKWIKYKNRLTFAYYSITFWDFCNILSLQSVPKTCQVLKAKNIIFQKMFKYQNTVFYDFKSRFLVTFSCNYWHHLVL